MNETRSEPINSVGGLASSATRRPATRIGDLPRSAADRFGAREAVVDEANRLSWLDLDRRCEELSRGFFALGLVRGDRVALWMDNCTDWVAIYFALARNGLIVVPINTRLRPAEVAYIVDHAGCRVVIVGQIVGGRSGVKLLDQVTDAANNPIDVVISTGADVGDLSLSDMLARGALVNESAYLESLDEVEVGDLAMLLYTSGTTGFPKGVMHSHRVIQNMTDLAERMRYSEADKILLYMPLFHVFANLAGVIAASVTGACVVLMSKFDARRSLDIIQAERITVLFGVPTTYHDQIDELRQSPADLTSLRFCFGPGSLRDVRQVDEWFGSALNIYGMTETTSTTAVSLLDDTLERRSTTVGKLLPGPEVRIVDDRREPLPVGAVGEIAVRGHVVMLGYYRDAKATSEAIDSDGWFYTGDLGRLDAHGYLSFVARKKDMIKVGGENVDPVDVESRVLEIPGVDQAAAVGVADPRLHEVVCVYIVKRPGADVSAEGVLEALRPQLASFKLPRHVRFVSGFPVTGSGKVQKVRLREEFEREKGNDGWAPSAAG